MGIVSVIQALDEPPVMTPTGGAQKTATAGVSKNYSWTGTNAEGGTTAYDIDWGDGSGHTTGNATGTTSIAVTNKAHTYATAGSKVITITTTDSTGNRVSSKVYVTVDAAPVAAISAPTDNTVVADHTVAVQFGSTGSSGVGITYAWEFGDSGTATTAAPAYTYSDATARTITLTVTDRNGATATATTHITFTA